MTEKPRTGRVLRVLSQVEAEELERMAQYDEWAQRLRDQGCSDPEDPAELAKWQAEQDRDDAETLEIHRGLERLEREDAEALQKLKDDRPLGVPPPIEPRSIHSRLPEPAWKRKLRP